MSLYCRPITALFPPGVAVAQLEIEDSDLRVLTQEELALIRQAVPKRQREFAAGRQCARLAMAALDIPPSSLPAGADRAPIWPAIVVGSITHTNNECIAVVGRREDFAGLGVDAEPNEPVSSELWETLFTEKEQALLARSTTSSFASCRLIFSAKECFYKCQYPLSRTWLDFCDVEVELDLERAEFVVHPQKAVRGIPEIEDGLRGQFGVVGSTIVTAMAWSCVEVPAPGPESGIYSGRAMA